jgi:hypothetical protein
MKILSNIFNSPLTSIFGSVNGYTILQNGINAHNTFDICLGVFIILFGLLANENKPKS